MSEKLYLVKQKELEMKIISYLIQNPNKHKQYNSEEFQIPLTHEIFNSIKFLHDNGHTVTLDEIHILTKKKIPNFEYSDLANMVSSFKEFDNITLLKKELKDKWVKFVDNKKILSEATDIYQSGDDLEVKKLEEIRDRIDRNISYLTGNEVIPTMADVIGRYDNILEERTKTESKRTLGFPLLDSAIGNRLGKKGSMMTIFGFSGSGKSTFTLAIANALVNNPRQIPVIYFTLENSEEDVVDMLLSMRTEMSTFNIENYGELTDDERHKLAKEKRKLANLHHFHIYDESALSVSQLEAKIINSKEHFREKGVLPDDEYCVVIIDLATMLTDFEDLDARRIEQVVNRLHRLCRKEKLFMINVVQANENDLRGGKKFENVDQIKKYRLLRENIKHGSAFYERSRTVLALKRNKEMIKNFLPEEREEWESMEDILQVHIIKNNKGATGLIQFSYQPDPIGIAPWTEK